MIRTLLRGRRTFWVSIAVIAVAVLITHPFNAGAGAGPATGTVPPAAVSNAPGPSLSTRPPRDPDAGTSSTGTDDQGSDADGAIHEFTPGPPVPADPAGAATVSRFARAWIRRDLPAPQWWTGIAAFTTASYAEQLRTVDPSRIPAARLTGEPKPVLSRTDLAVYTVATDTGTLQVTVAPLAGAWTVTHTSWQAG
jgi:hypothetical protein